MNWLARFMYGRNGADPLTVALLVIGFAVSFVGRFFGYSMGYPVCMGLSYVCMGLALFRMLSKNIYARQRENRAFMKWWTPVCRWFSMRRTISADKAHRHFRCPNCREYVRIPRGVGRVRIRCKRCTHQFERKA